MPEREKIVLTLYYYEGLTLAEIGQVLGVTESRVCQIHTKAVLQLRLAPGRRRARAGSDPGRHPGRSDPRPASAPLDLRALTAPGAPSGRRSRPRPGAPPSP